MQLSGIEGEQVVLILEDHQVDGSFLELINSLLSAGEVPGLYTPEELEPLLGPLRDLASQDGFRGTLVSYFASRVKRNLHIVLIMDSSSKTFTGNCESNPAFYKSCSFQWMEGWSRESMAQSKSAWSEVNKWGTSLFPFFLFYHMDVFIRLSDEPWAPEEIGDTCKQTKQNKKITATNTKACTSFSTKDADYARNWMWSWIELSDESLLKHFRTQSFSNLLNEVGRLLA